MLGRSRTLDDEFLVDQLADSRVLDRTGDVPEELVDGESVGPHGRHTERQKVPAVLVGYLGHRDLEAVANSISKHLPRSSFFLQRAASMKPDPKAKAPHVHAVDRRRMRAPTATPKRTRA